MTMRQWLCFPPASAKAGVRLRVFRVLLELEDGRIFFASIRRRQAPDEAFTSELAGLVANDRDACLSLDATLDSLGTDAHVLDEALESRDAWAFTTTAADVLAEEVVERSRHGIRVSIEDRQAWEDALGSDLDEKIGRFIAGLETSVVEAARAVAEFRPSTYNFLLGSGPEVRRNRIQAARLFPVLLPFLLRGKDADHLISAIDGGLPLIDNVVAYFGVSKSALRCLKEVPLATFGAGWIDKPGALLRLIADLAPERRPSAPAAWERFNAVVQRIAEVSRQPVTTTSGRLQLRLAADRGFTISANSPEDVHRASRDIDEFFERLSEVMRWELRSSRAGKRDIQYAVKRATDEFLSAYDIVRIGQIARRWQDAFLRAQVDFAEDREIWLGARWPSPVTAPVAAGKSVVVPIVTAAELAEEGQAMKHCVASYAGRCMRGESQVFSVRAQDGERLSTVETAIGLAHSAPTVAIIQHRAQGNRTPSVSNALAAACLISHMRSNPDALREYLHWKSARTAKSLAERTMIALVKPVTFALRETLPKRWSLDALVMRARYHVGEA